MADYGAAISLSRDLSHTSDDSSAELSPRISPTDYLSTPVTNNFNPAPSPSRRRRKNPPLTDDHHLQSLDQPAPKIRGRPRGSKNKPKPPIIITRDGESSMRPAILEISAGSDVIEAIIHFARRNRVGVSLISATGSVSNVTLRNPLPHPTSAVTLHGPFNILALCGSFVGSFATTQAAAPPSSSAASSSSSPNLGAVHACSSFGVTLAGAQGQVFGGIVAGKMTASAPVMVVAATFLNPTLHRLPAENHEAEHQENDTSSGAGAVASASERCAGNGISRSPYSLANLNPINCQMPAPDIMHWGPPSRPPY
ncbi:hypothetical protein Tsubulata_014195 [Turnera subulata]|uniref:PPC domain-containing protein n=1 Tax=Turnera subulata TaxID=218843 RepID=A0A9Q0FWT7_9ROSI|nr:hypothetical protein Tsubulata_014195 [Turnera subulata]